VFLNFSIDHQKNTNSLGKDKYFAFACEARNQTRRSVRAVGKAS